MITVFSIVPIGGVFTHEGIQHIRKVRTNGENAYVKDTDKPVKFSLNTVVDYSGRRQGVKFQKQTAYMKNAPRKINYCCY